MPAEFPPHRYVVLACTAIDDGGALYLPHDGADTMDEAQRLYLDAAVAHRTTDVVLVERVPVVLHDGRSAQGRVLRLAEQLAWVQRMMNEHGLSPADLARHVRFGASSIDEMLRGEVIRADWVQQLVHAVQELVPRRPVVAVADEAE